MSTTAFLATTDGDEAAATAASVVFFRASSLDQPEPPFPPSDADSRPALLYLMVVVAVIAAWYLLLLLLPCLCQPKAAATSASTETKPEGRDVERGVESDRAATATTAFVDKYWQPRAHGRFGRELIAALVVAATKTTPETNENSTAKLCAAVLKLYLDSFTSRRCVVRDLSSVGGGELVVEFATADDDKGEDTAMSRLLLDTGRHTANGLPLLPVVRRQAKKKGVGGNNSDERYYCLFPGNRNVIGDDTTTSLLELEPDAFSSLRRHLTESSFVVARESDDDEGEQEEPSIIDNNRCLARQMYYCAPRDRFLVR